MKEKTNTVYARIVAPEHYDYRDYEMDVPAEVIIDGGRDFEDIDNDDRDLEKIKKFINAINDYTLDYCYNNSKKEYIKDYIKAKDNGKEFSPKEIQVIWDASWRGHEEDIAMILSIIHCKRYKHQALRGCSQGDYADAYYPAKSVSQKKIDWVEAWFFGTGYEIEIHDEENIPQEANDVCGYFYLTTEWNEQGIIDEIKRSYGKHTKVILWDEHGNQIEG